MALNSRDRDALDELVFQAVRRLGERATFVPLPLGWTVKYESEAGVVGWARAVAVRYSPNGGAVDALDAFGGWHRLEFDGGAWLLPDEEADR